MGEQGALHAPAGDPTGAMRHLMQVGGVVRQFYAKRLGVGRSDFLALGHLCAGPIQPRELGVLMGMGSGTLTPLLDRLEQEGYAVRTRHLKDRRRVIIELTPRGNAVMDDVFTEFDGVLASALSDLGLAVDLGEFARFLEGVVAAVTARLESSALE